MGAAGWAGEEPKERLSEGKSTGSSAFVNAVDSGRSGEVARLEGETT